MGVGRGTFADLETLRTARTADHEILAPGTNVLAPALGGGERRWTGTSFATPFVVAHVARIVAARPGIAVEAVKAALHQLARGGQSPEAAATAADRAERMTGETPGEGATLEPRS